MIDWLSSLCHFEVIICYHINLICIFSFKSAYKYLLIHSSMVHQTYDKYVIWVQGWIQRFWKRGTLYVGHHGWLTKKLLSFRWSKKAKRTLETKVFGETFLSVFSNFLHFNESLPMKSYQFFKIYICFYKKREKTLIQQSSKKEKLRKFGLCFI